MNAFRIDVPLLAGPWLIEASAGTGKTWSISRLVARLLAEDPVEGGEPPSVDQVLVVTFTNAATDELRDRIRTVLVDAARALRTAQEAPPTTPPRDAGLAVLVGHRHEGTWRPHTVDELARREARLLRAVRDFDTASIATIHSFCQQVLPRLTVECNSTFDAELLQDDAAIVTRIVDDWLAANTVECTDDMYQWLTGPAGMTRERLLRVARKRVDAPGARFLPDLQQFASADRDWRAALPRHVDAARAVHAVWTGADGEALLAVITAGVQSGVLNRASYKLASLQDKFDAVSAWLDAGAIGEAPNDLFTRTKVGRSTNKGKAPPDHPLLDAVEALSTAAFEDAPLAEFSAWVAAEHARLIEARHAMTFNDLLRRVEAGLQTPEMVSALRRRYRAALIDEFQDTDAVQWKIFRKVFLDDPSSRLILIGDPKQAIYAFRGADIDVYVDAKNAVPVDRRSTMTINHRTDAPTLEAVGRLLADAPNPLLHPDIAYIDVTAHHTTPRLFDATGRPMAPIAVRWFDASLAGEARGAPIANARAEEHLAAAVARDVAEALAAGGSVRGEHGYEPLSPGHFAVLTSTNHAAAKTRDALVQLGVPAVVARSGSVFESSESEMMGHWLAALADERDLRSARALAISALFGMQGADLVAARLGTDAEATARWTLFLETLSAQRKLFEDRGFQSAFAHLLYQPDGRGASALDRVAASPDAERRLTNLRHLAEILDAAVLEGRLGVYGLRRWYEDRRERRDADAELSEMRLESDADTVQVLTMHSSKGLEYPVVYLPNLADGRLFKGQPPDIQPIAFHDPLDRALTVDLRGLRGANQEHAQRARREILEERQRLLYVALTRARHRLVVYAGPTDGNAIGNLPKQSYAQSPLGLLFHGSGPPGGDRVNIASSEVPPLIEVAAELRDRVVDHGLRTAAFTVTDVERNAGAPRFHAISGEEMRLPPRPFRRTKLDDLWRRESYTGLVGHREGEAEQPLAGTLRDDDAETEATDAATDAPPAAADPLPMASFPRGAEAGTWVHAVFEHLSFPGCVPKQADPRDLPPDAALRRLIREQGTRNGFHRDTHDTPLVQALPAILSTPLGGPLGGFCLGALRDEQRLDELAFDLPIAGGDSPNGRVRGDELAGLLGRARSDGVVPETYLAPVRAMGFRALSGFLHGIIDLVFRAEVDGRLQWFVADYKTNTLGPRDADSGRVRVSGPEHYARPWMLAEITRKHYYIQYILYLVALHRYLEARLPRGTYDYTRDVGGAAYLFVRGMRGPDTVADATGTYGVFFDKPPFEIIDGLSRLFARTGAP